MFDISPPVITGLSNAVTPNTLTRCYYNYLALPKSS